MTAAVDRTTRVEAVRCLHELFEEQVDRAPESVAVTCDGRRLTYRELDVRANRLAHALRRRGVGAESLVGVAQRPGVDLVVALLGVLKSGGAYVPLDLDHPDERLAFIAADTGLRVVVAGEDQAARLGPGAIAAVRVSPTGALPADDERPAPAGGAANLAYVIHTSGTTGRPKGVAVTHANVARLLGATADRFRFGPDDVWTMFHSFAFDFSVWELWGALLTGGRLVVVPPGVSRSPEAFRDLLVRERVTMLNQTPSAFRQLARALERGRPAELSLRTVVFGGEALDFACLRSWMDRHGDARPELVNMYGITETTVHVTHRTITARDVDGCDGSLIGRPIDDLTVHVLDAGRRPVPAGQTGELYVGGPGVARGYLGRPGLTADRFVPDPFGSPGARMYRSGDLARLLPNGDLEYLGRGDRQVKVRGYRIELGEVESVLRRDPDVEDAVVLVDGEDDDARRLVACVVAGAAEQERWEPALRARARAALPPHMLPARYVAFDRLPLTVNGKLDRAVLGAAIASGKAAPGPYAAPRTEMERIVAELWAELLGVQRVGVDDDVFELGANSLLAVRMASLLDERASAEPRVEVVLDCRTPALLAAAIEVGDRSRARPRLVRSRHDGDVPASFGQEQVWFVRQLDPRSRAYNAQSVVHLRGSLDVPALEASLDDIVRRHEILRTAFVDRDGHPVQVVQAHRPLRLPVVDLSRLPAPEREARWSEVAAAAIDVEFDVGRAPLVRWTLVELSSDDHRLLHVDHHFVHDGWSFNVFLAELCEHYAARVAGGQAAMEPLAVQYADFALWQRRWLGSEDAESQLAYWTSALASPPPPLDLPTDRERPSVPRFNGAAPRFELPADLGRRLRRLGREQGTTLFMTMLAGFVALLHRYTGQTDLVVGSALGARRERELASLIGMVVNAVALRTRLRSGWTFERLLAEVRRTTLEAYANQELPLAQVVRAVQPDRDLTRNPLYQASFSFHDSPLPELDLPGLDVRVEEAISNGSAKFDLNVTVLPHLERRAGRPGARSESISVIWEYNADLFDEATVRRMVEHYRNLLDGAAREPTRPIDALPLLSEPEQAQVVAGWNQETLALPGLTLPDLFRRQAARTPDVIAVTGGGGLTFRDLDRRSDALAGRLRGAGAGPERVVGVCLGRSIETVVALLGVLKSGAAYLPLDPDHPRERLEFVLRDSGAVAVVTDAATRPRLPACTPAIDVRGDQAHRWDGPLGGPVSSAGLAYMIYTSGSTGRPKGVAVEHRAIANRLLAMLDRHPMDPSDRILQKTALTFDASIWELMAPLVTGARLVLAPAGTERSARELVDAVAEHGITVLQLVPSMLRYVVEEPCLERCASLRLVFCAGEPLTPELAARARSRLGARLVNTYGPTETAIDVSSWTGRPLAPGEPVPIGRPLANVRLYVLDAGGEPAPVGVPGELHVGGGQVARGYAGRPALTAERFVPDPFSPRPGGRLYRTGDRARWLADGNLVFAGRLDDQVKLRGFRIEPGEVERVLDRQASVRQAVVRAVASTSEDARLVAYVVPGEAALDVEALRRHLREHLPEYMIPADFVAMSALPLTPSGKVDRGALPAPARERPDAGPAYAAPRTALERAICETWREVLGLDRVGVRDDFFRLGGHSLLAMQVLSRLRDRHGVDVSLRTLFNARTVEAIARTVADVDHRAADSDRIRPVSRGGPVAVSFAQQRLWFLEQLDPGSPEYLVPLALRLRGALDRRALEAALDAIVARHEVLRARFESIGGEPVQVIDPVTSPALESLDLSGRPSAVRERHARELAREEAVRPFDLGRGPLVRGRLLRLAADDHVLLLTTHHMVSDGWSMGILARELSALYAGFAAGAPIELPPLPVQYADFARWQREALGGDALERQAAYWREELAGIRPLELPTDRPRPAMRSWEGAAHEFGVPGALATGLRALSRQEGATLFMTLLAAFQVLIGRYGGQSDVPVGTPIAGRGREELEGLIGLFVNTLVLRGRPRRDVSVRAFLRAVRDGALGAFSNQDLPFEQLVEAVRPRRDLSRNPLFQVMFALQNASSDEVRLPGLDVSRFAFDHPVAKFDLTLGVRELADGSLGATLEYSTALFEPATIERLARAYVRVLEGMAAGPDTRLEDLEIVSGPELEVLLGDVGPPLARPPDESVVGRFEAQAAARPDAVAVTFGRERLTYGQLDARANLLARRLRDLGVGPEAAVAVCLERTPDLVVALLGVLKAGGAYVPMGVEQPDGRLDHMLADSGAVVTIAEGAVASRLAAAGRRLLSMAAPLGPCPAAPPAPRPGPDGLAYLIYTSGSTGVPKAVMVAHRAIAGHCRRVARAYGLGPGDRVLHFAAPVFDVSLEQILTTLTTGATLVLPTWRVAGSDEVLGTIACERVTVTEIPPAFWHELARDAAPGDPRLDSLRLLVLGGDAAGVADYGAWVSRSLPAVANSYGPTEAVVTCTAFFPGQDADVAGLPSLPIGRAFAGTRVLLLDADARPVPIGVPGEICVGGECLARGYLGRPGLTAERFVPDPYAAEPGARFYRTGDVARRLPGGDVVFLGRADEQVKVRGFRVEPGEIEAALALHPSVGAAAVTVRPDRGLAAYLTVREDGSPPTPAALRDFLRSRVPAYMLPSTFTTVPVLPVTPSGKIDRAALPAPDTDAQQADEIVAPRTSTEEVIARIWRDVLGLRRVSVTTDFFELGGHSLLATRVVSRLADAFGVEIPLRELFEGPRIADLAATVERAVEAEIDQLTEAEIDAALGQEEIG